MTDVGDEFLPHALGVFQCGCHVIERNSQFLHLLALLSRRDADIEVAVRDLPCRRSHRADGLRLAVGDVRRGNERNQKGQKCRHGKDRERFPRQLGQRRLLDRRQNDTVTRLVDHDGQRDSQTSVAVDVGNRLIQLRLRAGKDCLRDLLAETVLHMRAALQIGCADADVALGIAQQNVILRGSGGDGKIRAELPAVQAAVGICLHERADRLCRGVKGVPLFIFHITGKK